MIRAIRPAAMAQDDAAMIAGWNIAPNLAYLITVFPGETSCGVLIQTDGGALVASGAALTGSEQPCILMPQVGQNISMIDSDLGWHLLLTTAGTESQRTIRIGPAVDLPDDVHPVYGAEDLAVARATAAIDAAAHYIDDVTVTCPLGLGAGLGDVVSVPVDGAAMVGQVESITWTATLDGASEQAVIRRHAAIAPEPAVAPPTPPSVADDTGETDAATTTSGNVLTNDGLAGLTVTAVNGLAANVGQSVAGSAGGVFVIAASGDWTFDPDGDFAALEGSETAESSVAYHAGDGAGEAMATLTVTISAVAGGTPWTPAEIAGAVVFDALDSARITLDGSAVTAWADMLGSGITATQATPALRPAMGTGEVIFAADYLTIASSKSAAWCKALHSTGGCVFAVAEFGAIANPNVVYGLFGTSAASSSKIGCEVYYDDRSSNSCNNAIRAGGRNGSAATIDFIQQDAVTAVADAIMDFRFDPDNTTASMRFGFAVNGGARIATNSLTATPSTADASHDLQIGAVGNNVFPLTGKIRCIAFVPTLLGDDDAARFAGWAAHRHGLTDLLPSDHPYKSTAPSI